MALEEKLQSVDDKLREVQVEIHVLQQEERKLLSMKDSLMRELREKEVNKVKESLSIQKTFPWSDEVQELLENVFKLKEFRYNQKHVIDCVLSNQSCFVIMPTGGGKSLCYQLASLVGNGFALVITPLLALMQDQCVELLEFGIPCGTLNSQTSKNAETLLLETMKYPPSDNNKREKLIYISPEMLVNSKKILSVLEKCYKVNSLNFIVVDEAHCCSEWGHDFRPDYKKLSICKALFPDTPILAMTATAAPKVVEDVKELLSIENSITYISSVNRENLYYSIRPKHDTTNKINAQIVEFIEEVKLGLIEGEKPIGIIYCLSRKDTEQVSTFLKEKKYKVAPYHASLESEYRENVINAWKKEQIHIVVATIAFGLGINKKNVRFVLHHTISKSLDSYYQESGRAGRDGEVARCCILYSPSDVLKLSSMVYYQKNAIKNIFDVTTYASNLTTCRKNIMLSHFGENTKKGQLICCDNCARADLQSHYIKNNMYGCIESLMPLLKYISQNGTNITFIKLAQNWKGTGRGATIPSNLPKSLSRLSLFNCQEVLIELIRKNFITLGFHNTAYSTVCYPKPVDNFLSMSIDALKTIFDYDIILHKIEKPTKIIPKKRKQKSKNPKPLKIQKVSPSSPIDIDSHPSKKEESTVCIDLVE